MHNITLPFSTATAAAILLAGCSSGDGDPLTQVIEDEFNVTVQVLHASPDAPDVNVLVDGDAVLEGVSFKQASAAIPLIDGEYDIVVSALTPVANLPVINLTDTPLEADTDYIVIATGFTEQLLNGGARPLAELIIANPDEAVGAGNARVQVIHGAPSAPEVSVFATALNADLTQATPLGTFEFRGSTDPEEVPADIYQIRVTLPFDPLTEEPEVVFDAGEVELADGDDLIIVAVDNTGAGDSLITALVLNEDGLVAELQTTDTPADVRAVHASPDAGAVDILVDDTPVVTGLEFPDFTGFLDPAPAPGTYNLKIVDSATGTFEALNIDPTFEAGKQYTAVAIGTANNIQTDARILEDDNRSVATEAKVRILHAAPSTGNVDIYVTDGPSDIDVTTVEPDIPDVEYRGDRGYVGLADGSYDIRVTLANNDAVVAIDVQDQPLTAGCVYTIIARDAENQVGPLDVILIDECAEAAEN